MTCLQERTHHEMNKQRRKRSKRKNTQRMHDANVYGHGSFSIGADACAFVLACVCSDGEIARSESEEKRRRIALTASYGLWPLSMPPRARHVGACLSVVAVSVEQTQVSFLLHKSTSIVWRHGHQSSHLFLQSRVWYRLV